MTKNRTFLALVGGLVALAAVAVFKVSLSTVLVYGLILACPLMMMFGMHGRHGRRDDRGEQDEAHRHDQSTWNRP